MILYPNKIKKCRTEKKLNKKKMSNFKNVQYHCILFSV